MVSLTLMARLVEAVRPDCRLVLVGDPDQLASVEAGAVLGDLVAREASMTSRVPAGLDELGTDDLDDLPEDERAAALHAGVVRLSHVHRFSGRIKELAEAVRAGSCDDVLAALDGPRDEVELVDVDAGLVDAGGEALAAVRAETVRAGEGLVTAARAGNAELALERLDQHRLLRADRQGAYGVQRWSDRIEHWLREEVSGYAAEGRWYVGRPLLVTSNDYQLRLFNGDTGVVVADQGTGRAAFRRDGVVELLPVSRLSEVQTVHAMSVHRSQGSQFDRVTLVLPPAESPLLTRELLYTAITRATAHVRIIGSRDALLAAVQRPVARASGLRHRR